MLSNFHKKEAPIQGLAGFGGGITRLGLSGGGPIAFIRAQHTQYVYYANSTPLQIDSEGNAYWGYSIKTYYNGNNGATTEQGVIEKIDPKGNILWQRKFWGNNSQDSTFEYCEFDSMVLNRQETLLAFSSYWRDSSASTQREVIGVLDPSDGSVIEIDYLSSNGSNRKMMWHNSQYGRLYIQGGQNWGTYSFWVTGPNKGTYPVSSVTSYSRSDNYASSSPSLREIALINPGNSNDYYVSGSYKPSNSNTTYYGGIASFTQNATSPQSEYQNRAYFGSSGTERIIPGNLSQSEYICSSTYRNNSPARCVSLQTPYSGVWERYSTQSAATYLSDVTTAYDSSTGNPWMFAPLGGTNAYRRFAVCELSASDGSIVQSKTFYVKTYGGSQSNPSAFSLGGSYQSSLGFRVDTDFVYVSGYSDGYGATSRILMKLPRDLSTISNGTYTVISSKVDVIFETTPSFQWDYTSIGALTSSTSWTSSGVGANTLNSWPTTVDYTQTVSGTSDNTLPL